MQSISQIVIDANYFNNRGKRKSLALAYGLTIVSDYAAILLVALGIHLLQLNPVGYDAMLRLSAFLLLFYSISGIYAGAFDLETFSSRRQFVGRAPKALAIAFALMFMVLFLLKVSIEFSRLIVALLGIISLPIITFSRWQTFGLVKRLREDAGPSAVLVVDGIPMMERVDTVVIDAASSGISTDLTDLNNVARIAELASQVGSISVLCPPERRHDWAKLLKCVAVRSEIYVPELDDMRPLALGSTGSHASVVVSQHPLFWHQAAAKRIFDVVVSALLLILVSPILLVTAVAIKLESPGPALFSQRRLGFGNRMFVMLKFRSMRHDHADINASRLTERGDARVTRVGAFLRRNSIDELPQLFNVFLGDMSMVGPRPHAPAALAGDKLYWEVDEKYWQRHIAKPGITGLAQVRGFRGNTFEEIDLQSRLDADLEYVSDWSLTRDLEILLATFRVMTHDKAF